MTFQDSKKDQSGHGSPEACEHRGLRSGCEVGEPRATVWVCSACGKRSRDRIGNNRISRGWDAACYIHAVLCWEDSLRFAPGDTERVVAATAAEGVEQ